MKYVFTPDDQVTLKFNTIARTEGNLIIKCRLLVKAEAGAQLLRISREFNTIGQRRLFNLTTFSVDDSVSTTGNIFSKQARLGFRHIKHLDIHAALWLDRGEDLWRCMSNLETFHMRYHFNERHVSTRILDTSQDKERFRQQNSFTTEEVDRLRDTIFRPWYRQLLANAPATIRPSVSVRVSLKMDQYTRVCLPCHDVKRMNTNIHSLPSRPRSSQSSSHRTFRIPPASSSYYGKKISIYSGTHLYTRY